MALGGKTDLEDMTAVPAAWPVETVLEAWLHTAVRRYYGEDADFQNTLELLEQRLVRLWERQPLLDLLGSSEAQLTQALCKRDREKLQRCLAVISFTNKGLLREDFGWDISSWSWLEAPCQRLARLTAAQEGATEEAQKRRRVEEDSAARELQKAKEESAHLAGRLQEAQGFPNLFGFHWGIELDV